MKPWILGGASAAALISVPCAGWSLTAQEAWQNWQNAASSYGQTMTNDGEQMMDGKLTVRGVKVTSDLDDATVVGTVDEVVFAEQGDGSVRITMSEEVPLAITGTDPESGEKIDIALVFQQPGMELVANDADGGAAFTFNAPSLVAKITEFKLDDAPFPVQLTATLATVAGTYTVKAEPGTPVASSFQAGSLAVDLNVEDPAGSGKMDLAINVQDLASESLGKGMDMAGSEDMAKMLADGFAAEGRASYGPATLDLDMTDQTETVQAAGTLTGGSVDFALGADGMGYDVVYQGLDLTVSGSQIPFPQVGLKAESVGTSFAIPVSIAETASPFGLRTAIEGLQVGEEIWSLFDPAGVLPRDPATLIVDLAGTGRWMVDIFNEEEMMSLETSGQVPGEVETVDLKELKLAFGGAELTGEGAFAFDNTDTSTFNGMPRPEGKANLRLVGGNGLLDKLTQMGLVPQDQVMMVRMMAGMFAKPGAGPDELLSEIAIDGSGKLLINGAPMPF